jgi:ABC-2 type transport system permease protein
LILGKLIPFTIIGFADVMIVLALAHYWFNVPLLGSLLLLFGLSGLFILTTLGLGLFISTIAKTQQQAMLIAQFFFFMPFMFLSGFTFPIANMPQSIQLITWLIPLRYFLEIVRGIFLKGTGMGNSGHRRRASRMGVYPQWRDSRRNWNNVPKFRYCNSPTTVRRVHGQIIHLKICCIRHSPVFPGSMGFLRRLKRHNNRPGSRTG